MLFMVAAMAAEMERDLIRERTLDGVAAAHAQGRRGGRPCALDADTLAVAVARRARGESVTAITGTSASADPPCTGHSANLSPPETDPPTPLTTESCSAKAQTAASGTKVCLKDSCVCTDDDGCLRPPSSLGPA